MVYLLEKTYQIYLIKNFSNLSEFSESIVQTEQPRPPLI